MRTLKNIDIKNRYAACLFLLCAAIFFPAFSFASPDKSDSAEIYYGKKEFEKVIACYNKILEDGKDSWKLEYNLGNAYFKTNQLGEAILHYEIAKKMNPRDEDIRNNLMIADSKLIDKMEVKENFLENEIRMGVLNLFSTDGWAWLSIFSLFAGLGLIFLFIASSKSGTRKIFFWSGSVVLLAFIFIMVCGFSALKEKNSKTNAVIISSVINIFNEPASESKKPFQLHEGTRLRVLNTNDGWTNVQLLNGNEGWVKSSEIGVY